MKTTYFERITTRPVTVQKEVCETADVPVLDLTALRVEVLNWPGSPGEVLLNGVLLKGARLTAASTSNSGPWTREKVSVTIQLPGGTLELDDAVLVLNQTNTPNEVEWRTKPTTGVCCVVGCCERMATLRDNGRYRCNLHHDQLHPSKR